MPKNLDYLENLPLEIENLGFTILGEHIVLS